MSSLTVRTQTSFIQKFCFFLEKNLQNVTLDILIADEMTLLRDSPLDTELFFSQNPTRIQEMKLFKNNLCIFIWHVYSFDHALE